MKRPGLFPAAFPIVRGKSRVTQSGNPNFYVNTHKILVTPTTSLTMAGLEGT